MLMRYTLRLLTLDQLSRAATLICALEMERQQHADKLGDWPFEIGLYVPASTILRKKREFKLGMVSLYKQSSSLFGGEGLWQGPSCHPSLRTSRGVCGRRCPVSSPMRICWSVS